MAFQPKSDSGAEPQKKPTQTGALGLSVGNTLRDEEIRRRAYEIYLERGEQPGHDLDDWLRAERELEGDLVLRAQAG